MKKILYLFLFLFVFLVVPCSVNATLSLYETTDNSTNGYYSDSTIYEIWSSGVDQNVYCLDHGKPFDGSVTDGDYTIWGKGPACALVEYGNGGSGSTNLHNRIRYIQYHSGDTYTCSEYKYVSGNCNSTNKAAAENPNASLSIAKSGDVEIIDEYYVQTLNSSMKSPITSYNISLENAPDGTIVTSSKTELTNITSSSASTIYVKVPIAKVLQASTFKVAVTGSYNSTCKYSIPGLEVHEHRTNPEYYQRIGYEVWDDNTSTKTFSKSSEAEISVQPSLGDFKLRKIDYKTGNVIPGVKFMLYTEEGNLATYYDGSEIGELTTDANGYIEIKNLIRGTYLLRETSAPEGYSHMEEDILLVLDSEYIELDIPNDPILLKISKQDITSFKEVEGAKIVIRNKNKQVVKEFVSGKNPTEFYISPGIYTMEEVYAPKGYDKVKTIFTFEIYNDGTVKLIDGDSDHFVVGDDGIIIYNDVEKVVVPDTLSNVSIIAIVLSTIAIGVGVFLIIKARKNKETE